MSAPILEIANLSVAISGSGDRPHAVLGISLSVGANEIVCLVGENIRYTRGVARRVFNALDGINIRMISQGASLLNISFVVAEPDLAQTVAALHGEFFAELDPAVFERNEAVHA